MARRLGTHFSALLGGHYVLGTIVFVLGVTVQVMATVAMIWTLKPTLQAPQLIASGVAPSVRLAAVPAAVLRPERLIDVLMMTIGPFLAVYAVWSIIDQWVSSLYLWNIVFDPFGAGEGTWSVSMKWAQFPIYLSIGLVAFGLRLAYGQAIKRQANPWLRLPLVFLEGLWTFCLFFITLVAIDWSKAWLMNRAIYRRGLIAWRDFVDALPSWPLPFDQTLPQAVDASLRWLLDSLLPQIWTSFCLPLVWLALCAIVMGWRDFRVRDVLSGRLATRLERFIPASESQESWVMLAKALGADLRDKYLPVLHSLVLIWRAGPRLLGVFLVVYAVLTAAEAAGQQLFVLLFSPDDQLGYIRFMPLSDLPASLIVQPLIIALLVATLDRALFAAIGRPAGPPIRPQTPTPVPVRPPAASHASAPAPSGPPGQQA